MKSKILVLTFVFLFVNLFMSMYVYACPIVRQTAQITVKHKSTNKTIIQDSISLHMQSSSIPIYVAVGHTCKSFTPAFKPVPGCYAPFVTRNRWPVYLDAHKTNTYQYVTDSNRWIKVISSLKGYANGVFVAGSRCEFDSISSQQYYCDLSIR